MKTPCSNKKKISITFLNVKIYNHTFENEIYVYFFMCFTAVVLDNARVYSSVWDLQIVHVHCSSVLRIHSGVLPCRRYIFNWMESIHKSSLLLKVKKCNILVWLGNGAVHGHISTNLPLNLMSPSWERKVSRTKGVRAGWKSLKHNESNMNARH